MISDFGIRRTASTYQSGKSVVGEPSGVADGFAEKLCPEKFRFGQVELRFDREILR
jgi:hypothetical protein